MDSTTKKKPSPIMGRTVVEYRLEGSRRLHRRVFPTGIAARAFMESLAAGDELVDLIEEIL
jgi:hypothetical protein